MFRASTCPSSGENFCIYATLVLVTLKGDTSFQSDKYQCRVDTAIFSRWWAHGCPKHEQKRNK